MKSNEFYIREAIKEAKKAYNLGEVPVGCVIVVNDKIVARSHNLRESKKSALAHAEILAIEKACKKLNRWILDDATIYVTLEPCIMCAGAIFQSRIGKIVYGAKEPKFGALGSLINLNNIEGINHKAEVIDGVLAEEISQMMRDFFKEIRKIK